MGAPLRNWEQWAFEAQEGLLAASGIERRGGAHRGGPAWHTWQTASQSQDGKYGVGASRWYIQIRAKVAMQDRC